MEILVSVAIGFTFVVIALAMCYNSSQGYKIRLAKLQSRNQELAMAINELKSEIETLRAENSAFRAEAGSYDIPIQARDIMPSAAPPAEPRSVVSTLLREGHVTAEQVRKAEKYKQDNASPYSIEEILVLLNMVSPAAVSAVREKS